MIAITLTTINKPTVIESYIENIQKYNHNNTAMIIVEDMKTPNGVDEYCKKISKDSGIEINYMDVDSQKDYLKRFEEFDKYLPFNSFARRNIGDLLAYEEGFDFIIRVDDDNYPTDHDFIGMHSNAFSQPDNMIISSNNGWYNVCELLKDEESIPFYPRGFLYNKRWLKNKISSRTENIKVVLNAGLWLGDPDVDAITRLCKPINAVSYDNNLHGNNFALDIGTWCPINTQNTSYARELIPASFVPPNVGRYDDIWSGYLIRKITDHLKHYVTYGAPLLFQKRNEHNLWDDLNKEINGNIYSEHLINNLIDINLGSTSYVECYYELAEKLDERLTENRDIFNGVIEGMKIWANSISKII